MDILLAIVVFTSAIALMSIGVMFKRKAIRGSCGGLSRVGIESDCDCKKQAKSSEKSLYKIQEPDRR